MGVLDEIVRHKRDEVETRRRGRPVGELRSACHALGSVQPLEPALRPGGSERVRLIAEVKRASPSKGILNLELDPVAQARAYAGAGAAALSVLTDARWFHGSIDDLVAVRAEVVRAGWTQPLLRKEFVIDEYQLWESRAAGADAVLLIVAAMDGQRLRDLFHAAGEIGLGTLVEAHTEAELEAAVTLGAPVIGINNRDLQSLATSLETSLTLLPLMPPGPVAVSESGIVTRTDVERVVAAGADAVLVGEALVRAGDVAAAARDLRLLDPVPAPR
jgi:indole-3-glycerol phosphate synthase